MKTCFLRHGFYPACQRVRKETHALLDAGYSVDVLCLRLPGEKLYEKKNNLRIFRLPLTHKRDGIGRYVFEYLTSFLLFKIYVFFLFCINRYSIIQVNTLPDVLVFTTLIPKLFGARIILDIHEPTPELWVTKYGDKSHSFIYKLQKIFHKLSMLYADHCISVTDIHARHLQKTYAVNPDKLTVIENVCDSIYENFAKNYKPAEKSNGSFKLITHGAIEKRYGHEVAIRAIADLKKEIPDIQLLIAGSGAYKNNLMNLVDSLDLNGSVEFLGFVPKATLLEKLMDADIGLVTMDRSPYSELIETNKMYEYMAMKKPVIMSRLGYLEEKFGDACFEFFTPGNADDFCRSVLELYANSDRRQTISKNAYDAYKRKEWTVVKKRYLDLILGLAESHPKMGIFPFLNKLSIRENSMP